jgi:hypothetical protein
MEHCLIIPDAKDMAERWYQVKINPFDWIIE